MEMQTKDILSLWYRFTD